MIVLQGTGWKMMIPDESITDVKPLTGPYPRIGFLVENSPIQFIKHFETDEERDAAVERIRAARAQKEQADSIMNAEAVRAMEQAKARTEIELDRMREEQEAKEKKRRQRAAERRKAEQEKPRAAVPGGSSVQDFALKQIMMIII